MILATTIQERLKSVCESPDTFMYDFDIRYLQRWINSFPFCFPKFILSGTYESYYNADKMRWEIKKV